MKYRKIGQTGETLSALGLGAMRLPTLGAPARIDAPRAIALIREAIDAGISYIDTAWPYHGQGMAEPGASEPLVGEALEGGYRQKVKIATKSPVWLVREVADFDKYLDLQLERLGVDCVDFYLLHALNGAVWERLSALGAWAFLERAKADGRVKHVGFSYHGTREAFSTIIEAHPWDFCMIQYNYLDQATQGGREGLERAAAKGMAVMVMEPLRGGTLAQNLPEAAVEAFAAVEPDWTPVEWALRWLWDQPGVSLLLSGMSTEAQLAENLATAARADVGTFTPAHHAAIEAARVAFAARKGIGCTTCGYCMPCPTGVDIPMNFSLYNDFHAGPEFTKGFTRSTYLTGMAEAERASACVECGACEAHCPQGLPIIEDLQRVAAHFEAQA